MSHFEPHMFHDIPTVTPSQSFKWRRHRPAPGWCSIPELPSGKLHSPWKITMLIGKSAINRQFSIIMLVYQRVEGNLGGNPTAGFQEPLSPCFIRFPASRVPSSEAVCDLRHHRQ